MGHPSVSCSATQVQRERKGHKGTFIIPPEYHDVPSQVALTDGQVGVHLLSLCSWHQLQASTERAGFQAPIPASVGSALPLTYVLRSI